ATQGKLRALLGRAGAAASGGVGDVACGAATFGAQAGSAVGSRCRVGVGRGRHVARFVRGLVFLTRGGHRLVVDVARGIIFVTAASQHQDGKGYSKVGQAHGYSPVEGRRGI